MYVQRAIASEELFVLPDVLLLILVIIFARARVVSSTCSLVVCSLYVRRRQVARATIPHSHHVEPMFRAKVRVQHELVTGIDLKHIHLRARM